MASNDATPNALDLRGKVIFITGGMYAQLSDVLYSTDFAQLLTWIKPKATEDWGKRQLSSSPNITLQTYSSDQEA